MLGLGNNKHICTISPTLTILVKHNLGTSVDFGNVLPENLSGHCFHTDLSQYNHIHIQYSHIHIQYSHIHIKYNHIHIESSLLFYWKERCNSSDFLCACMSDR